MNDAVKPRILLVEDDPAVQNLVSTALVLHGYSVEKACNGQAAIMEAASHGPDLIMLDLGLPDIDGVEVITKIRSWSAVPITVISARTEDSDKITALDAGADDYLTKPFSVEELLARVRASLRRSSMAASEPAETSTFDNGPLHIDYAAGYATIEGHELSLTPTEYKLLVLLAKNVDKVLTHTYITREIWGTSWDSDIASLRVFMRTLRKKVESEKINLSDDILDYIAENIKSNIRELEGALNKLIAYSNLEKSEITMDIAMRELQNIIYPDKPREVTPQLIIEVVSEHYNIPMEKMLSKDRSKSVSRPRQIAMFLCNTMTDATLEGIGQLLNGRDHSTILHGRNVIEEEYNNDEEFRKQIDTIKKKINPN